MLGALLVALGYAILERNPTGTAGAPPTLDDSSVVRLYEEKRSGEMVEGVGIEPFASGCCATTRTVRGIRDSSLGSAQV